MTTVLVVDDKEMMRDSVAATLHRAGFTVQTAADAEAALEQIARKRPDAVVSDFKMPGMTGIDLVERVRQIDDGLPVVLMTAFGTIATAVEAMKKGAFDFLIKPFEGDQLIIAVKRAVEHARVQRENSVLRALPPASTLSGRSVGLERVVGDSPAIRAVKDQLRAIAQSQGTVLVTGESGSGKEVVARAIHDLSPRASGPFLAVNCAALSESLLESELFGHERGSFTGAEKLRKGRFELADGGTLVLDEVSEVSPRIQAKLLRVLQERSFERVGSSLTIGVDVRVIATSNRDLPRAVAAGEFRQDLYFRLNVLPIRLPALRERRADVRQLAEYFVRLICEREGRAVMGIDAGAGEALAAYDWPGNVRELQNICERAVVLGGSSGRERIEAGLVAPWLSVPGPAAAPVSPAPAASLTEPKVGSPGPSDERTLEEIEREAVVSMLHKCNGHRQRTALALGIGVRTLGLKLKKWKQLQLIEKNL